ncbi:MAG TPA: hypothetical protein VGO47_13445 [Chlamydiales bacterium]|nr:hypothetical protein [Chlamydiales bacterium]
MTRKPEAAIYSVKKRGDMEGHDENRWEEEATLVTRLTLDISSTRTWSIATRMSESSRIILQPFIVATHTVQYKAVEAVVVGGCTDATRANPNMMTRKVKTELYPYQIASPAM